MARLTLLLLILIGVTHSRKQRGSVPSQARCEGAKCDAEPNDWEAPIKPIMTPAERVAARIAYERQTNQPYVRLEWHGTKGWAVHASRHIKAGTVVMSANLPGDMMTLPKAKALLGTSAASVQKHLCNGILADCSSEMYSEFLMTLLVLVERRKGAASEFAAFFALLADHGSTRSIYFLTEAELRCLPPVDVAHHRHRHRILRQWRAAVDYVAGQHTALFPGGPPSRQEFNWAYTFTKTRVTEGEAPHLKYIAARSHLHLVNHDATRGLLQSLAPPDHKIWIAAKDYQPGEEFFGSYGELSVQSLLMQYGFVPTEAHLVRIDAIATLPTKDPCREGGIAELNLLTACVVDSALNVPLVDMPEFKVPGFHCRSGRPHRNMQQKLDRCSQDTTSKFLQLVDLTIDEYEARMGLEQCQVQADQKNSHMLLIREMHQRVIDALKQVRGARGGLFSNLLRV